MKDQFEKTVAVELQLHESVLGWSGSAYTNQYTHCLFKGFCIGWQHRQTEMEELKASHHGEVIGHEHHIGKIKKERDELQKTVNFANKMANLDNQKINELEKRMDKALSLIINFKANSRDADCLGELLNGVEQTLKGEHDV